MRATTAGFGSIDVLVRALLDEFPELDPRRVRAAVERAAVERSTAKRAAHAGRAAGQLLLGGRAAMLAASPPRRDRRPRPGDEAAGGVTAFIPFGAGVHKCIGDHYNLTEVTLALSTIAARWHLSGPHSTYSGRRARSSRPSAWARWRVGPGSAWDRPARLGPRRARDR